MDYPIGMTGKYVISSHTKEYTSITKSYIERT